MKVSAITGLLAAFLVASAGLLVFAQQKEAPGIQSSGALRVAVINVQRVASESQMGKAATARAQALNQQKVAALSQMNTKLQADQQKLASEGLQLTDAARMELQRSIADQQKDLQRAQQDAQDDVQQLRETLQQSFEAKLTPVIKAVAQERKLSLIFRVEQGDLVYWDRALDLTEEVVKRIDTAEAGSAQPAATGATGSQTPPKQ
jgi:outer membrane protein